MSGEFMQGRFELADLPPLEHPDYAPEQTIDERFAAFHELNPHVYDELRRLALDLVHRGRARIGIGMLFEVLRWSSSMSTIGDEYRLNNDFRSRYARLLAAQESELAEAFEFRALTSLAEAS